MGELHLEITRQRMADDYQVETLAGRPQIAFRETISRPARAEGEYKHQTGGKGQYGDVVLVLEPNPDGGSVIENEIVGGTIPKELIRPTIQGIEDALRNGVLQGSPVTDVRCRIVDGAFHPVDSSEIAFRIAGRMAFKNAMALAGPVLLEPIMAVEVNTPTEYQGEILGDLTRRRGEIRDVVSDGVQSTIHAEVPLQALFGYAMDIRSLSKGRASYSMSPSRYAPVVGRRLKHTVSANRNAFPSREGVFFFSQGSKPSSRTTHGIVGFGVNRRRSRRCEIDAGERGPAYGRARSPSGPKGISA